jgi:hypothetical protein
MLVVIWKWHHLRWKAIAIASIPVFALATGFHDSFSHGILGMLGFRVVF